MLPTKRVLITEIDGMEVCGQLMYVIVWEGKALSGRERLVNGEDIESMEVEDNAE